MLKKKNRFGLFFKRLLTLNEDSVLGYSQDPATPFDKIIKLSEETKIARIDKDRFSISNPDKKNPSKKKDKVIVFKCNDSRQCDEWLGFLLHALEKA